jgi:hypothetical protein
MEHGFEFIAAKPKKAADDEPYAENMRGDRKITKNPSTDQKKVRRAQQRKTALEASVDYPDDIEIEAGIHDWFSRVQIDAALDDAPGNECRICGEDMSPGRQNGNTTTYKCPSGHSQDVQEKVGAKTEMSFLSVIAKRAKSVSDTPEGEL